MLLGSPVYVTQQRRNAAGVGLVFEADLDTTEHSSLWVLQVSKLSQMPLFSFFVLMSSRVLPCASTLPTRPPLAAGTESVHIYIWMEVNSILNIPSSGL